MAHPSIGRALILACAATGTLASAAVLDDIRARNEIRVGYRVDAPPISYKPANAQVPQGFAIELCRTVIGDLVQRKLIAADTRVVYVPLSNAERFQAIVERKVDVECADTTNNRERREKIGVAFSIPHYYAGVRTMVAKGSGMRQLEDLKGKTVLVTRGTTTNKLFEDKNASLQLNASMLECSQPTECFSALAAGKAQAYMMDDIMLFSLRAQAERPGDWEVIGKMLSVEPLAIMLPKGDPEWKQQFDDVLRRMIANRSFHAAYQRWFEQPIPPANINYNIPMNYLLKDSLKFPTDSVGD